MQNSTQRSNHFNHNLAYEARLNRLHRIFKTHFNVTEPSMVLEPYLFLGNCISAHDVNRLARLGIRYILNVAIRDVEVCPYYPQDMRTLTIDLRDDDRENILRTFDQAFAFIDEARRAKSRVLVHCSHGQSRSPAIVIAYLMRSYHVSLEQCLMHVVKARPCVIPNDGFLKQLILYDRFLVERRRHQQQEALARKQKESTRSGVTTEIPVQQHSSPKPTEPVQTSVAVMAMTPTSSSTKSDSTDTHLSSVDSSSVGISSMSSVESSSSASSIHVVPIQMSRPKKNENKLKQIIPVETVSNIVESTKNVEKKEEKLVQKKVHCEVVAVTPPIQQSPETTNSIPITRSNGSETVNVDIYSVHDQPESPLTLSVQQWNFLNQYPTKFFDADEYVQTSYITEIYDRATNRFIPTTCCY